MKGVVLVTGSVGLNRHMPEWGLEPFHLHAVYGMEVCSMDDSLRAFPWKCQYCAQSKRTFCLLRQPCHASTLQMDDARGNAQACMYADTQAHIKGRQQHCFWPSVQICMKTADEYRAAHTYKPFPSTLRGASRSVPGIHQQMNQLLTPAHALHSSIEACHNQCQGHVTLPLRLLALVHPDRDLHK